MRGKPAYQRGKVQAFVTVGKPESFKDVIAPHAKRAGSTGDDEQPYKSGAQMRTECHLRKAKLDRQGNKVAKCIQCEGICPVIF